MNNYTDKTNEMQTDNESRELLYLLVIHDPHDDDCVLGAFKSPTTFMSIRPGDTINTGWYGFTPVA